MRACVHPFGALPNRARQKSKGFCPAGSHPTDVRMTTRFKENDLTEGLTGAIHETGHALYEQGRNLEYDGLPVNQVAVSFATNSSPVYYMHACGEHLSPVLDHKS